MASCGHIFENPLPDNSNSHPTWNQVEPNTEIFGELHFKETSSSSSTSDSDSNSSSPFNISSFFGINSQTDIKHSSYSSIFDNTQKTEFGTKKNESFSLMNYESLQLCTEGLGFESSGDVEDSKSDINGHCTSQNTTRKSTMEHLRGEFKRTRTSKGIFPPPISCIGESGKPWVCFKSYREDGRFVLKEMRIPTPECLRASREDGRLKLHFIHPDTDIPEDEEEDDDDESIREGDEEENKTTMISETADI